MAKSSDSVPSVKVIGEKGEISLGTQFAGRQVVVEERNPGVWLIRTATAVPDNERSLDDPRATSDLPDALAWVAKPARETDLDDLFERLNAAA